MEKQWKPVKNYDGLYEVSNFGEIKSLGNNKKRREKLLKPGKNSDGYLYVVLYKNGVVKKFLVHRLVYSAFVGEIPEGLQCNHIDENKENNRVDNLNLMTSKENNNWGTRNRRAAAALRGKSKSPEAVAKRSKAVEAVDKVTGRVVFTFPSTAEAERQGFDHGHVAACCRGELKSHKGFIWRYKENAQA
jgi:hypothetical protein